MFRRRCPTRHLIFFFVPLLTLLALACGGGEEAQPTATPEPDATATQTATEPTLAVETGGIQGFRLFARLIEQAIAEKDSQFFVDRAVLSEETCTGEEVLGPCPGQPAGTTLTGILGYFVPGDADWLISPGEYAQVLDQYFGAALGEMSDEFGGGSLVLYALFQSPDSEGRATFLAITTSIVDTVPTGEYVLTGREAHGFRFLFEDGRWRFTEELVASVTADSPVFLVPPPGENSVDWERWNGSAP